MAYSFEGAHYLDEGAPQFPPRTHFTASNLPVLNVRDVDVDNSVTSKRYVDSKSGTVAYQLTNFYSESVRYVITDKDLVSRFTDVANPNHLDIVLSESKIDGHDIHGNLVLNNRVLVSFHPALELNGIYKVRELPVLGNSTLKLIRTDFTQNQYIPHHLHVPVESGDEFSNTVFVHSSITLNAFSQEVITKIIAGQIIDTQIIDQLVHVLKIGSDALQFHKIGTAEPNVLRAGLDQPINIKFNNVTKAKILNSSLTLYGFTGDDEGLTPNSGSHHGVNEIWGVNGVGSDFGILKLSAGGGTNRFNKTSIYLHGYNTAQGTSIKMYVSSASIPLFTLTTGLATVNGNLMVPGIITSNNRITATKSGYRSSVELLYGPSESYTGYIEFYKNGVRTQQFGYDHLWSLIENKDFRIEQRSYNNGQGTNNYHNYLIFQNEDVGTKTAQLRTDVPFVAPSITAQGVNLNYVILDANTANLYHAPFYSPGAQFILDPIQVNVLTPNPPYELLQWTESILVNGLPNFSSAIPPTKYPFRINENYMYNVKVLRYSSAANRYPTHPPIGMDSFVLAFQNVGGNTTAIITRLLTAADVLTDPSSYNGGSNIWTINYQVVTTAHNVQHSSLELQFTAHSQAGTTTFWQLVLTRLS